MQLVAVWEHIDLRSKVTPRGHFVPVAQTNRLTRQHSGFFCVQCLNPVKCHFLNQVPISGMLTSAESHAGTIYRRTGTCEAVWLVKNKSLKFN